MNNDNLKTILLFSGKRKSGKDYITDRLLARFGGESCEIIRISAPIKAFWSNEKQLDLTELLSDGPYKEKYRKQMIEWSDEVRSKDYGFFCREASKSLSKEIVIVSDIRRQNDIRWFRETFQNKVKLIRIKCDDQIRINRGWKFEDGIDNIQSECDLDDFNEWNLVVENDGLKDIDQISDDIQKLIS
ncbi:unnamed protein product [Diamesa hyperborea]